MEVSHSTLNKLIQLDSNKDPITKSSRDIQDPTLQGLYIRWLKLQQYRADFERDVLLAYKDKIEEIERKINRELSYDDNKAEVSKDATPKDVHIDDFEVETYTESDFATAISK